MEEKPLVSVVCISMNHGKYIEQGVTSFVNQTWPNIEFLYLDNASSDNTFEIADPIFKQSGRPYQGFKRERSYNLPENFNFLISKAKGDYLSFISCDDWMLPQCIEEMVTHYQQHPQYGLVYTNGWYYFEDKDKTELAENKRFRSGKIFDHVFEYGVLFPVGIMVKKETFQNAGTFDESIPIEDYAFWLKVAEKYEIGYSKKPMLYYRKHSKSMTGLSGFKNIKYYLQIIEKYKNNRLYEKVKRNFEKYLIYEQYLKGERSKTIKMIFKNFHFERFYFSVLFKTLIGKKYIAS